MVQETLARLSQAKYYTKLDIIAAFNHICIAEGQEWLTAFNIRYGLFKSLVMPFGLSNAPATWQTCINDVLRLYLNIFCTAYIDDILIYSDNLEDHHQHIRAVMQALNDVSMHIDMKKCKLEVTKVCYLGMIISTSGVEMDPQKVTCITGWEPCNNIKDVQAFLGFSNFYRRFIKNFSRKVHPLVHLTQKNVKFEWNAACKKSFKTLKDVFTDTPILRHYDPKRETFVEADASDYVSAGVISQLDNDGVLHPVAFMSMKYTPSECNYEIYNKELLVIIHCFETWRAELQGLDHLI